MSSNDAKRLGREHTVVSLVDEYARGMGYKLAWGPLSVVDDVASELATRRLSGELDRRFAEVELGWFRWPQDDLLSGAASVVVVAVPRPIHTVTVDADGHRLEAVLPPTYVRYGAVNEEVVVQVASQLKARGRSCQLLRAPLKAVAGRLGLVRYGRNNISYHPALGSGLQLVGLVTDVDLSSARVEVGEARIMEACESCDACRSACPTGAIDEERFLLRAERCLTHLNEHPGDWPHWLSARAHNSLVGCMLCQEACPENVGTLRRQASGVTLDDAETRWLLDGAASGDDPVARSGAGKIRSLGLTENMEILGRNLRVLVDSQPR